MRRVLSFGAILLAVAMAPATVLGDNQKRAEEIADVLQAGDLVDGCDIGLKYEEETVWLTGVVDSSEKIAAIQAKIENLDGVSKVVNQLEFEANAMKDTSVQQVAGYQRSIIGRPAQLSDLSGERIISDEVIAVNGVPVNQAQSQAVTSAPSTLPSVLNDSNAEQPTVANSNVQKPRPIQVNYGTSVKSASYGSATVAMASGQPKPMNAQAYSMPRNGNASMRYDAPYVPKKAWPSYASYPNTAAVQYPKRHVAGAWPFIGPHYPYPQVPDGWRKVSLEWHDGYWHLDFDDGTTKGPFNGLFRQRP